MNNEIQFEGNGVIMEIEEAKFQHRNSNIRRTIDFRWYRPCCAKDISSGNSISQTNVISSYLKEDYFLIYSDCWNAYVKIHAKIYQRCIVKHSLITISLIQI